jgi:cephalosporin hydroxylase
LRPVRHAVGSMRSAVRLGRRAWRRARDRDGTLQASGPPHLVDRLPAPDEALDGASVAEIVESFHRLYFNSYVVGGTWQNTYWLGTPVLKCPLDLWCYQEILAEVRPDLIVESGTAHGGTSLFLATICDVLKKGKIVTIDIEDYPGRPEHERILYLRGSSTSEEIYPQVRDLAGDSDRVMVILDSDHSRDHVSRELTLYSPLVSRDSYIVVEDTNVNGHPVLPEFGPGPMEAVEDFLRTTDDFVVDARWEKFYMTFNPRGYLRRVRD